MIPQILYDEKRWATMGHRTESYIITENRGTNRASTYDFLVIRLPSYVARPSFKIFKKWSTTLSVLQHRTIVVRCRVTIVRSCRPSYAIADNFQLFVSETTYINASYRRMQGDIVRYIKTPQQHIARTQDQTASSCVVVDIFSFICRFSCYIDFSELPNICVLN